MRVSPLIFVYSRAYDYHGKWHNWAAQEAMDTSVILCEKQSWHNNSLLLVSKSSKKNKKKISKNTVNQSKHSKSDRFFGAVSSKYNAEDDADEKRKHAYCITQIYAFCIATNSAKTCHVPQAYRFCQPLGRT